MKRIILFAFTILMLISSVSGKSGSMKLLAVSGEEENQIGSTADLLLEINEGTGRIFIDSFPLSKLDTQISTRFAKEVACNFLERDCSKYDFFYTIRANSEIIGGPSASAAITVLTISVLDDVPVDRLSALTGTINTGGIIGPVGGIVPKAEAGAKAGLKKIIIPKFAQANKTKLEEIENKYGIKVIEVSRLNDAMKAITGKDYGNNYTFSQSQFYIETMGNISGELCARAQEIADSLYNNSKEKNITAKELLSKGSRALERNEYYSAASFCFGSGLSSRYKKLKDANLNDRQVREMISEMIDRVNEFKNLTQERDLKTITDLEAYMVVTDRLVEAKDHFNDALFNLATNNTNGTFYSLAYGIERLNSAHSWSVFFGKPGRDFDINKKVLDDSCLKKISEVEERIQYIELYLPSATDDAKLAVKKSYDDYNLGNSELCLYKASIAKAKIDLVLNSMAINEKDVDNVIEDRSIIVKEVIAKQNKRGIFPILAYSYYEYANSLKESDKYSALLYLEYALELGSLDIYFEKKSVELPRFDREHAYFLASGFIAGVAAGVVLMMIMSSLKKQEENKKR